MWKKINRDYAPARNKHEWKYLSVTSVKNVSFLQVAADSNNILIAFLPCINQIRNTFMVSEIYFFPYSQKLLLKTPPVSSGGFIFLMLTTFNCFSRITVLFRTNHLTYFIDTWYLHPHTNNRYNCTNQVSLGFPRAGFNL